MDGATLTKEASRIETDGGGAIKQNAHVTSGLLNAPSNLMSPCVTFYGVHSLMATIGQVSRRGKLALTAGQGGQS